IRNPKSEIRNKFKYQRSNDRNRRAFVLNLLLSARLGFVSDFGFRISDFPIGRPLVADEEPKTSGPFDINTIRALVALMSRHDLSEIDLRQGEQRICLRRGPLKTTVNALPPLAVPAAPPPAALPAKPAAEASAPAKKLIDIKSPTPGTFYARPNPEAEPYVKVGSRVEPKTVVC